jgi:prepilin-type N-terminal cleavage/methylation domain-containing protein
MIEEISKKKGFTLIEITIVIAIIALLSVTAAGSYLSYRKASLLDFSADNIVSQFYQMRSQTVYGEGSSERFEAISAELAAGDTETAGGLDAIEAVSSSCYGIYIPEDLSNLYIAEVDFVDKKVWFAEGNDWNYEGCETFIPGVEDRILAYDADIQIISFTDLAGNSVAGQFVMGFEPPNGAAYYDDDFFLEGLMVPEEGDIFSLTIQFGEKEEIRYQRIIEFDLFNLTASVKKVI